MDQRKEKNKKNHKKQYKTMSSQLSVARTIMSAEAATSHTWLFSLKSAVNVN